MSEEKVIFDFKDDGTKYIAIVSGGISKDYMDFLGMFYQSPEDQEVTFKFRLKFANGNKWVYTQKVQENEINKTFQEAQEFFKEMNAVFLKEFPRFEMIDLKLIWIPGQTIERLLDVLKHTPYMENKFTQMPI